MTISPIRALVILCAASSTAACATVARGSHQTFNIQSEPSGAQVKTSNGFTCEHTPCSFRMERNSEFEITVAKDGYKTWSGHVTHAVSVAGGAGMAGSVLLGGFVGAGVDASTGAIMDLKPNPLKVTLEKDATAPAAQP